MTITVTDIRHDVSVSPVTGRRLPRRIPTPISQPPFDDERSDFDSRPRTNGSLALSPVVRRVQPPHLELVVDKPVSRRSVDDETLFGRQPTPTAALPDVRAWAGRLGRSVAEVLTGDRPAQQLMRWTNDAVFADLCRRSEALAGAGIAHRGMRNRVSIISVHVCEPVTESPRHRSTSGTDTARGPTLCASKASTAAGVARPCRWAEAPQTAAGSAVCG